VSRKERADWQRQMDTVDKTSAEARASLTGVIDPTGCANDSYFDPLRAAVGPCPRCGHNQYGGHQHQPCDMCRMEIRIRALEARAEQEGQG